MTPYDFLAEIGIPALIVVGGIAAALPIFFPLCIQLPPPPPPPNGAGAPQ